MYGIAQGAMEGGAHMLMDERYNVRRQEGDAASASSKALKVFLAEAQRKTCNIYVLFFLLSSYTVRKIFFVFGKLFVKSNSLVFLRRTFSC